MKTALKMATVIHIVEYNNIYTRNRLEIGIDNGFKVKLTAKRDSLAYTQSLSLPINFN